MKISIIHPSYGRPDLAYQTCKTWFANAKDTTNLEYILCISEQDSLQNKLAYSNNFYQLQNWNVKLVVIKPANMVKQGNHAASLSTGDLLIQSSDDFDCPIHWDYSLVEALCDREDYIVKVNDGGNSPGIDTSRLCSIPIMDRKYYSDRGYIYHPKYNHFYADEELFMVGKANGKLITLDLTFEHKHFNFGKSEKDATNRKNSKFYQQDKRTFKLRERAGFTI